VAFNAVKEQQAQIEKQTTRFAVGKTRVAS
jgi:hypothetical protein